jgi:hypothetical protein
MAPVVVADDRRRMNSNVASASLPTVALRRGALARDVQAVLDFQDPRRRAFGRTRWSSDLIDDIVEHPATIWGVQPVMAALQRGRVKRIVIADDLDANTADRLIRHAVASAAELTLADAGALGPLGVAARPRG